MSVFCSNTLIFVPECWKCTLRGPDFKIFPRGMPWTPPGNFQYSQVAPVEQGFSFSAYSKSFCHLLKTLLKTLWSRTWTLELEGNFNELNLRICIFNSVRIRIKKSIINIIKRLRNFLKKILSIFITKSTCHDWYKESSHWFEGLKGLHVFPAFCCVCHLYSWWQNWPDTVLKWGI